MINESNQSSVPTQEGVQELNEQRLESINGGGGAPSTLKAPLLAADTHIQASIDRTIRQDPDVLKRAGLTADNVKGYIVTETESGNLRWHKA